MQCYQGFIVILKWACGIYMVFILLEVLMMYKHLALPREDHLDQVVNIYDCLKMHRNIHVMFDII